MLKFHTTADATTGNTLRRNLEISSSRYRDCKICKTRRRVVTLKFREKKVNNKIIPKTRYLGIQNNKKRYIMSFDQ